MPKVAQNVLDDFGRAVRRARSLKGWQLDQLSAEMKGRNASRSYLSNVEKGQRQISPPTVGLLIKALDLDEGWIDRFLDDEVSQDAEETAVDRETERLLRLKAGDDDTPDAAEDLLILLANTHAQGQYTDTFTAYQALRSALGAAERIRWRGEMRGNAGEQLDQVMAEVASLNAEGRIDEADGLLDAEEQRMRAAHRADRERQDAETTALLERRLDQDRLRNDPQAAAKRLIRNLHQQAPPGGVWRAAVRLEHEWFLRGRRQSDPFDLRVALALAKENYGKAKGPNRVVLLLNFARCQIDVGERASADRILKAAEINIRSALGRAAIRKNPELWAVANNILGIALRLLGERLDSDAMLHDAVRAYEDALNVWTMEAAPKDWAHVRNNLGVTLQFLGARAHNDLLLRNAVRAFEDALTLWTQSAETTNWAMCHNNLGIALRWRGTVTQTTAYFDEAEAAFLHCLDERGQDAVPFLWAQTQWNLGDLALARFALDPDPLLLDKAELHVRDARAIFAEGSDYQTGRCDELLQSIAEARRSA